MKAFVESIRHGFAGLPRFAGRDSAGRFWPYAGAVIALFFIAAAATMIPIMSGTFSRMQSFAAEHPDQATVTRGPGSYSIEIHGNHPELMPDMTPFFTVMQVGCAVAVLLLAAAVTRRLHDRGRRGWWGLAPVPFLIIGLTLFPRLFQSTLSGQTTPGTLAMFGVMMANNLLYLASLALLVVLLTGAGQPGENRFGPPPR
ncbi:uncharacterized membrane protein YhaH (DUF805 family) [Caulobacter rhizosphaerae]|jgi:uncharacterized membrane protein YhaH (DUF805 family)|uniref:Uncharacterized membrane protein YhaH (DUF805 family) n=1 Tax=Caulobacter rhizosphaerae TaxID=2010972 RepID=A0ABU1N526_9CAUL|nr:DUF805 domain-containing protein [Caulobacter rhizosphaerae]MDR6533559.1 uncharacterized membrane protein YhaH (DUF805 family) [Caulobacter rhizosphaerae]